MERFLRSITLVVALGLAAFLLTVPSASAATVNFMVDGVNYTANDSNAAAGATATSWAIPASTSVAIPHQVAHNGISYPVTVIGSEAFVGRNLSSVYIPNSVINIGAGAFANNNLTSVHIPNSVTTIGSAAFFSNNLASVTIPNSVTTIGTAAFYNNNLTSVTISNSLTVIAADVFYNNNLTSVTIPDSITSINNLAFANNNLTSVHIPNSVITIGSAAFFSNNLASVTIPNSVTSIGNSTFNTNPALTRVVMHGNAPTVTAAASGNRSFDTTANPTIWFDPGKTGFTTETWQGYTSKSAPVVSFNTHGRGVAPVSQLVWPGETLTNPGDPSATGWVLEGWFTAPTGGTAFNFPGFNAETTGNTTVHAQWSLASSFDSFGLTYSVNPANPAAGATVTGQSWSQTGITIPAQATHPGNGINYAVTAVGDEALNNNNLTSVAIPDTVTTIGEGAFAGNDLTSVTIPDSVTAIGFGAFVFNNLSSVTLGDSVVSIGDFAFGVNTTLARVIMRGNSPAVTGAGPPGSFDTTSNPVIWFDPGKTGFTAGTWEGYTSKAAPVVSFAANGHGIAPGSQVVFPGDTLTEPDAPTATGWVFDGWFTAATGGSGFDFAGFDAETAGDTTVHARWSAVPVTPTTVKIAAKGSVKGGKNLKVKLTTTNTAGKVTIKAFGKTKTVTVKNGKATATFKAPKVKKNKKYTVKATFTPASTSHGKSTKTKKVTVKK